MSDVLPPGGPHVVAVGGGHGLAATLRAARRYAGRITAIVTVADDGGSSGRLREDLGVPALGDLRLCLSALAADPGSVWARTSEHRFEAGHLEGHAAGNLILLALTRTCGGLMPALAAAGELVGAVGDVLPATTDSVVLKARVRDGSGQPETVEGQVAVATTAPVEEISLVPADAPAPPEAVEAIAAADQVVLGPGSLFTSVLAAAVVPAIREALQTTSARRVHVANLREQAHETTGFTVADHVAALHRHGVPVDVVLHQPDALPLGDLGGVVVVPAQVARPDRPVHDPELLAAALQSLT